MRLKVGVRLKGMVPQMAIAAMVVYHQCELRKIDCVITSANDSRHSPNSLHHGRQGKYSDGMCRAFDFRTKHYPGDKHLLREDIAEDLGEDFDVILEDLGGDNEHIHVEYDPE